MKTKQFIIQAMMDLLQEKSFQDITIQIILDRAEGAAINWTREKHQLIIPENQTFQQGQKVLQLMAENELVPLLFQKNESSLEKIYLEVVK